MSIGLSGQPVGQPWMERDVLLAELVLEVIVGNVLSVPDNVSDISRPERREFPFSDFLKGGISFHLKPLYEPDDSPLSFLSSRAFTIPFRSWQVVKSGARSGGFWFHSSCWRVSSVREGQFIVAQPRLLLFGLFLQTEAAEITHQQNLQPTLNHKAASIPEGLALSGIQPDVAWQRTLNILRDLFRKYMYMPGYKVTLLMRCSHETLCARSGAGSHT